MNGIPLRSLFSIPSLFADICMIHYLAVLSVVWCFQFLFSFSLQTTASEPILEEDDEPPAVPIEPKAVEPTAENPRRHTLQTMKRIASVPLMKLHDVTMPLLRLHSDSAPETVRPFLHLQLTSFFYFWCLSGCC